MRCSKPDGEHPDVPGVTECPECARDRQRRYRERNRKARLLLDTAKEILESRV